MQNLNILVCPSCYDQPFEHHRTIVLPPDPLPVENPRPERFVADDNPIQELGWDPLSTVPTLSRPLGNTQMLGPITDLVATSPTPYTLGAAVNKSQIWLTWTPVPGSKGTVIYRTRSTGTPPFFTNWEAGRVGYPGGFLKDGAFGPLDAGRLYTYVAVPYSNVDGGEGIPSAPVSYQTDIPYDQGFQGYYNSANFYLGVPGNTSIDRTVMEEVAAAYTVPTDPLRQPWDIGGDLYYFIGVQDVYYNVPPGVYVNKAQPVVQWGTYSDDFNPVVGSDQHWTAVNVMLWGGRFYMSLGVQISAGDVVTGKIKRNGSGDWTVSFVEFPAIDLHMTGLIYATGQELPGYGVTAGAPFEGNFLLIAAETYALWRDWHQNSGDFRCQILHVNVRTYASGAITTDAVVPYYITAAPKSGTEIGPLFGPAASPTTVIHIQQDSNWYPVNI